MNIDDLAIKSANTKEAVWFLPAPGLPPMLSPKFKKTVLVENSNTGGPPKTLFRELVTTTLLHLKQRILIGTLYVLLTEEKRKHTTILK